MSNLRTAFIATPAALLISLAATGCGKGTHEVTVSSAATTTTSAVSYLANLFQPDGGANAATTVTDFKVCISRIRLIGADGKSVKDDGSKAEDAKEAEAEIRFEPGLIDVSSGAAADWGKVTIPVGFQLAGLRVKVHKDETLCKVAYSLSFNGLTTSQDIEFKWKFDPALDLSTSTSKLELSLKDAIASLQTADINSLKDKAEAIEGSASGQ